jgi:DNA-binding response OmpR family regulator
MTDGNPTVLVADDDRHLADLYSVWLEGTHDVRTAYGGEEAIEAIDERVDVALVDRRMPRLSGEEVLERVREDGCDCRVAMVTAVEPDFDIIEMGVDEYVVKPIQREEIEMVVGSLVTRSEYDKKLQEFFALASKRAALKAEKTPRELEDSDAYAELTAEFERLQRELDQTANEMTGRDFEAELHRVSTDA